jgi:hypothetical protein
MRVFLSSEIALCQILTKIGTTEEYLRFLGPNGDWWEEDGDVEMLVKEVGGISMG